MPAAEPLPTTASEYLAEEVYPTLEAGIEELLKMTFPVDSEGTERRGQFPGGKPLVWLAQYLHDRNKKNSGDRTARKREEALALAGARAESEDACNANVCAAARSLFWPCAAYVAKRRVRRVEVPRPPAESDEAERAEGDDAAPAEGGGGDGAVEGEGEGGAAEAAESAPAVDVEEVEEPPVLTAPPVLTGHALSLLPY
jgi:hypothetical protein